MEPDLLRAYRPGRKQIGSRGRFQEGAGRAANLNGKAWGSAKRPIGIGSDGRIQPEFATVMNAFVAAHENGPQFNGVP